MPGRTDRPADMIRDMKPRRLALAATLLVMLAAPTPAKEILEYEWLEVRTPHFVIASAQKTNPTLELAIDLENFRSLAEKLTNIGRFEERIPTKIYLLPRIERDLGFGNYIAGYFNDAMRANYAAMIPSGSYSDEVLKHEYVHFLVHNRDRLLYPTWFDEGFAELLSTLRMKGTTLEYGKPNDGRVSWLVNGNWLPYRTVLNARDTRDLRAERGAMFYAQSWLLVHYLMIGNPDFSKRNADFLKRRERGESVESAFEAAFGIKTGSITAKVRKYGQRLPYYKGELREPLPPVETETRPLPRAEIAAELGTLALLARGADAAAPFYQAALAADPTHGPALTGVADIHKFAGRFDEARPLYEKAIALEPTNDNHELDYAEYFLDLAHHEQEAGKGATRVGELVVEARRHFSRAYQLNPDNPEILAMNGATYLVEGEDAVKGIESLEVAHQLLPAQTQIRLLLARSYIAAGQREKARPHLETLLAWTHSEGLEEIQMLLASLDAPEAASETAAEGNQPAR